MINRIEYVSKFMNQPVAILCPRYTYSGIVSEIIEDYGIVLSNAFAIEQTGAPTNEMPSIYTSIPSDGFIAFEAIEFIFQPVWCFGLMKLAKGNKK